MKKLLLFDIDGTLLTTDGASGRAFESALIDVYGTAGPIGEVSFAGKTDLKSLTSYWSTPKFHDL